MGCRQQLRWPQSSKVCGLPQVNASASSRKRYEGKTWSISRRMLRGEYTAFAQTFTRVDRREKRHRTTVTANCVNFVVDRCTFGVGPHTYAAAQPFYCRLQWGCNCAPANSQRRVFCVFFSSARKHHDLFAGGLIPGFVPLAVRWVHSRGIDRCHTLHRKGGWYRGFLSW